MQRLITEDFIVAWNKYVDIGKFFFNTKYNFAPDLKQNNYMHMFQRVFRFLGYQRL